MKVTVEISMYPLTDHYEKEIISFIRLLKNNTELEVYTNAMSTYVKGELAYAMSCISKGLEAILSNIDTSATVLKIINRSLPVEEGLLHF